MRYLGRIVRLQLQPSSLKRLEADRKIYDPTPLRVVNELTLTLTGACARMSDGSFVIDVHNSAHPQSRNNEGTNPISLLFTSHYARMRQQFGSHLVTGCAGESILIDASDLVSLEDVAAGVVIETQSGRVILGSVIVATPCAPFSHFALRRGEAAADVLKSALQFLDHGTRGFYCQLSSRGAATIAVGDAVFAAG